MGEETISVFIADDHDMVREGLAALLAQNEDIEVVGQCGDGLEVVDKVRELRPDVVVLDIGMPGMNGLAICQVLSRKLRRTAVLIVSIHNDEEIIAGAVRNGASGYLLKEAAPDQLAKGVRAVASGKLYFDPKIPWWKVLKLFSKGPPPRPTRREIEVLQLIVEGKTGPEIARQLGISPKTVESHRRNLMRKLNVHNQIDLVLEAMRRGLVVVPWLVQPSTNVPRRPEA